MGVFNIRGWEGLILGEGLNADQNLSFCRSVLRVEIIQGDERRKFEGLGSINLHSKP